ncbi:hypothetical protein PCANC_11113 [Puccinia coronata f. sp. avenae]|uniref:Uncharacterized protein n=1 Tax=Puccinia coronata f. sp. avenae TaxID=200324 RepID=A0A2N5V8U7_9BASI|nr:hypothetical protein PCANC_11113 [Puccinia coronata f. sp. avenae]
MLKESRNSLSIFLRPKSVIYKLFSHRYLLVIVIVATSQLILQLWLEGRSLVVHRQGLDLLFEIMQTRNPPPPSSEPPSNTVASESQPTRRSLPNAALQSQNLTSEPPKQVFFPTGGTLVRRDGDKNANPLAPPPASSSLRPSPAPQSPLPAAAAISSAPSKSSSLSGGSQLLAQPPPAARPSPSPTPSPVPAPLPPKTNSGAPQAKPSPTPNLGTPPSVPPPTPPTNTPQPPPEADPTGRDIKKVKAEEEVNKKRKAPTKSSLRPLTDLEKDPSAASILDEVNRQNGDPNTPQTTDVAAPGAAIFVLDGNLINLSAKCVTALKQPMQYISRDHRTDIVRMVFQIWLWGLTIWGLLLESIPHLAAVVISQFISLAFVALALRKSLTLKDVFINAVSNECDGVNVLPDFWEVLIKLDIVAVVFAALTSLAFIFLGFKLYSVLDWRTFKKLGASQTVRIAHTVSLIFAAILQLNAYFVTAFLALWLDEVVTFKWAAGSKSFHRTASFKAFLGIFLVLSIPWLVVGNTSLKNEHMIGIISFLLFDIILLIFTTYLLCEHFYQDMAKTWVFLNFTGIMACIFMFSSLIIAVACLVVFDKGLLFRVNRDSNAPSNSLSKPDLSTDEIGFPDSYVTPYNHQANSQTFSGSNSGIGSILSGSQFNHNLPPPIGFNPNATAEFEDSASWIAGDERTWTKAADGRPKHHSESSDYSNSSGQLSYATTTYTQ